ncbi:MAG: hypothetical protein WKF84_16710 [Pyrinomonadaceae bacterium]
MIIESSAPTRVDLAGGTIDIWPLYLFHPGAATVNFAISLYARCRIETRDDGQIFLESRDRQVAFQTELSAIEELEREERLELISKLVHFFKPTVGFNLISDCEAPAGAGLGGPQRSPSLASAQLNKLVGNRYPESEFITLAANVETTVIKVPAGFQDYCGAFYGGVNHLRFTIEGIKQSRLEINESELERRIIICYTGEPRLSGTNNWEIFKKHINGDAEIFSLFGGIRDTAERMRQALAASNWNEVSATMRDAYPKRKQLRAQCHHTAHGAPRGNSAGPWR